MAKPKISIITATFNSGKTLSDTLDSILGQTYSNYEVIIQDGGSTDNTKAIVETYISRFDGRLKWKSEPDKGLYDAMNKGIARAEGDVVGILNSDDFYADSRVLSDIADNIKDVEVVYGDLDFVDAKDSGKIVRQWRGSQYRPGAFLKGWHPAHPTFYVRRQNFEKLGNFDTTFDVSADFELMLRFLEKGQLSSKYIGRTFVKMRMGGESTGSISKIIKGNRNILKAFRKNGYDVGIFYIVRRLFPKAVNIIKNKLNI